jgi:hypothetical protein
VAEIEYNFHVDGSGKRLEGSCREPAIREFNRTITPGAFRQRPHQRKHRSGG